MLHSRDIHLFISISFRPMIFKLTILLEPAWEGASAWDLFIDSKSNRVVYHLKQYFASHGV